MHSLCFFRAPPAWLKRCFFRAPRAWLHDWRQPQILGGDDRSNQQTSGVSLKSTQPRHHATTQPRHKPACQPPGFLEVVGVRRTRKASLHKIVGGVDQTAL